VVHDRAENSSGKPNHRSVVKPMTVRKMRNHQQAENPKRGLPCRRVPLWRRQRHLFVIRHKRASTSNDPALSGRR